MWWSICIAMALIERELQRKSSARKGKLDLQNLPSISFQSLEPMAHDSARYVLFNFLDVASLVVTL